MAEPFRVGLTRDFLTPDGRVGWGDIGLDELSATYGVEWEFLPEDHDVLPAESIRGYDALIVLTPRVAASTLDGVDRLRVVARFGVGYDNVDINACTAAGVLVTITPDGVRRPVAVSALALILAATHRIRERDDLVRSGRWHDKLDLMGFGVTGRTLGLVGWGNIGREVSRMCAPLQMRQLAADPYANTAAAAEVGVELVELDELFRLADVVVVTCALTPDTHHLVNAERIELMKPTSFLVNVARGPIVDQTALTDALTRRRITGAALDVFDPEPPDPDDPLLKLDNVILSPHAIAWTDELARGNGSSAVRSVLDVAAGRTPAHPVNPAALDHARWSERRAGP